MSRHRSDNQLSITDLQSIRDGLARLKSAYPSYKPSEDDFTRTTQRYLDELRLYPVRDVLRAIDRAPRERRYFPSLYDLCAMADQESKSNRIANNQERDEQERLQQDERDREAFINVPIEDQQIYIDEAQNPFERLARQWECDTRKRGADPSGRTPDHVAKRRLEEFWVLWKRETHA